MMMMVPVMSIYYRAFSHLLGNVLVLVNESAENAPLLTGDRRQARHFYIALSNSAS